MFKLNVLRWMIKDKIRKWKNAYRIKELEIEIIDYSLSLGSKEITEDDRVYFNTLSGELICRKNHCDYPKEKMVKIRGGKVGGKG